MNLADARVVLRPRAASDVLDLAAPFCLRAWRLTLPLAVVVLGPALALCWVARHVLAWRWPAVWSLVIVLGALVQGPFVVAFGELLFRSPAEVRVLGVLRRAFGRGPAFVMSYVVTRVIHVAGLGVLVMPLFTLPILAVVPEVVCLEGAGPFSAIKRSARAVRSRGLAAFGVVCVLALLPVLGLFGGELLGQTVVQAVLQLGAPFGELTTDGGTVYAVAGYFLTVPIVAAARFLMYIDLRTRREGWDIQLKFMAIAAAAREGEKAA